MQHSNNFTTVFRPLRTPLTECKRSGHEIEFHRTVHQFPEEQRVESANKFQNPPKSFELVSGRRVMRVSVCLWVCRFPLFPQTLDRPLSLPPLLLSPQTLQTLQTASPPPHHPLPRLIIRVSVCLWVCRFPPSTSTLKITIFLQKTTDLY